MTLLDGDTEDQLEDAPLSTGRDAERRTRAVISDARSEEYVDLGRIWTDLTSGQHQAVDHFSTKGRCYLLVTQSTRQHVAPRLTPHRLDVLERVLLGHQQKAIASDFNVSPSTIAALASEALHALGLRCGGSQAPLALAMLVHAHRHHVTRLARTSDLVHLGVTHQVLSMRNPHESLAKKVSPAEGAVLRLRIDGKSHAEIARCRKASTRTVANQLASASRKLGVSGRSDLLRYLAEAT
jgi:DNA-binding NarL/FixJ family response regulator